MPKERDVRNIKKAIAIEATTLFERDPTLTELIITRPTDPDTFGVTVQEHHEQPVKAAGVPR